MARQVCPSSCGCFVTWLVLSAFAVPLSSYAQTAYGDLEVSVSPSVPTSLETFDLRAMQTFGDPGQERVEQSISIDGNQIHVYVLMRSLHDGSHFFPQVLWDDGAFFNDFGPLAAGTYHVGAEMWMRRMRFAREETVLVNTGSLTFDVVSAQGTATVAGDFNSDGVVDAADFVVWRKNFNGSTESGNGAGEPAFNLSGYDDWRANFGRAASNAASFVDSAAVPEPSAVVIVAAAVALLFCKRTLQFGR